MIYKYKLTRVNVREELWDNLTLEFDYIFSSSDESAFECSCKCVDLVVRVNFEWNLFIFRWVLRSLRLPSRIPGKCCISKSKFLIFLSKISSRNLNRMENQMKWKWTPWLESLSSVKLNKQKQASKVSLNISSFQLNLHSRLHEHTFHIKLHLPFRVQSLFACSLNLLMFHSKLSHHRQLTQYPNNKRQLMSRPLRLTSGFISMNYLGRSNSKPFPKTSASASPKNTPHTDESHSYQFA